MTIKAYLTIHFLKGNSITFLNKICFPFLMTSPGWPWPLFIQGQTHLHGFFSLLRLHTQSSKGLNFTFFQWETKQDEFLKVSCIHVRNLTHFSHYGITLSCFCFWTAYFYIYFGRTSMSWAYFGNLGNNLSSILHILVNV